MSSTSICLLVALVAALSIVLGNRRITFRHGARWAVHGIAACIYLIRGL